MFGFVLFSYHIGLFIELFNRHTHTHTHFSLTHSQHNSSTRRQTNKQNNKQNSQAAHIEEKWFSLCCRQTSFVHVFCVCCGFCDFSWKGFFWNDSIVVGLKITGVCFVETMGRIHCCVRSIVAFHFVEKPVHSHTQTYPSIVIVLVHRVCHFVVGNCLALTRKVQKVVFLSLGVHSFNVFFLFLDRSFNFRSITFQAIKFTLCLTSSNFKRMYKFKHYSNWNDTSPTEGRGKNCMNFNFVVSVCVRSHLSYHSY